MAPGKPTATVRNPAGSRDPVPHSKRSVTTRASPVDTSATTTEATRKSPRGKVTGPPVASDVSIDACDRRSTVRPRDETTSESEDARSNDHLQPRVLSSDPRATSTASTRVGACNESAPIPDLVTSGEDNTVPDAAGPRDEPLPVPPIPSSTIDASSSSGGGHTPGQCNEPGSVTPILNATVEASDRASGDRIAAGPCNEAAPASRTLDATVEASGDVGGASSGDPVAVSPCSKPLPAPCVAGATVDAGVGGSQTGIVEHANEPPVPSAASTDESEGGPSVEASRELGLSFRDVHARIGATWVLHCRVLARTPVRPFDTLTSKGQLFNAYLIDKMGETMRATVFNQGVDMFDTVLFTGAVCSLSGGKFKQASAVFSSDKWEVSFDDKSAIAPLHDASLLRVAYAGAISTLDAIPSLPVKSRLTVLGVIHKTTAVQRLKTKDGKPCFKSRVLIVDHTNTQVVCTFWGYHTKENTAGFEGLPTLIRGAEVSEHNGSFSLNVGVGCTVLFDPSGPEADELRVWYANLAPGAVFSSI